MIDPLLIQEAVQRLVERFGAERVILFGSQARGTADEHSDVDLLVVCRFTGRRRDIMVAMDRALRGLPFARDIVVLTPEEFARDEGIPGTVARPAAREGKLLYGRQPAGPPLPIPGVA
jgi:predicted nucleotidyltransferase